MIHGATSAIFFNVLPEVQRFQLFRNVTRLQSSRFFLSQPANDAREATCVTSLPFLQSRAAAHLTPVRWLGQKKGTALQSITLPTSQNCGCLCSRA